MRSRINQICSITGRFEGFLGDVRLASNCQEFAETGKVPNGMSIHEIDVRWDEIWRDENCPDETDVTNVFTKYYKRPQTAYSLAFALAAGLTDHTQQFTVKELGGDHINDWVNDDWTPRTGRRVVSTYNVSVTVTIFDNG